MKLTTFGLEIRKINGVKELYEDVDAILDSSGIVTNEVPVNLQVQTVAHSLHKMLKNSGYLSICTIKECAKIGNVFISEERMSIYQSLHCMNWSEMMEDYRKMIVAMILDDFRHILHFQEAKAEDS